MVEYKVESSCCCFYYNFFWKKIKFRYTFNEEEYERTGDPIKKTFDFFSQYTSKLENSSTHNLKFIIRCKGVK